MFANKARFCKEIVKLLFVGMQFNAATSSEWFCYLKGGGGKRRGLLFTWNALFAEILFQRATVCCVCRLRLVEILKNLSFFDAFTRS